MLPRPQGPWTICPCPLLYIILKIILLLVDLLGISITASDGSGR